MRGRPSGWATGMLLLCCASRMPGQEVVGPDGRYAEVASRLSAFIEHEMRDKGIRAISIALVDDQRVVWSRGFGMADSATGRRATAQTVYRVGSVSKLFTDIAVMQLVERGQVDLDAPAARYVPELGSVGERVTLRQLMSHYAGIVREPPVGHYFDDTSPSLVATVASVAGSRAVYPPGTRQKYSNAAIGAVGLALQRLAGMPFSRALQQRVLDSLGMTQTSFEPRGDLVSAMARGEMWTRHERSFDAPNFQLGMSPAGSMYTTMPELGRFMSALFARGQGSRGRVLKPETLESMWVPQFALRGARSGGGLGFFVGTLDGARLISHGGAIYGFATELAALPDEKLGIVVSASKDGMNALTSRVAREGLRLMRAVRAPGALPEPVQSQRLSRIRALQVAGSWGTRAAPVEIVVRDSTPVLSMAGMEMEMHLRGWRGDTLIADDGLSFGPKVWRRGASLMIDGKRFGRRVAERAVPPAPRPWWNGLIGEYGWDHNVLYIYEKAGRLTALIEWFFEYPLTQVSPDVYAFPKSGLYDGERLMFLRNMSGRAQSVEAAGVVFKRRSWVGEDGGVFRITPEKPVEELRRIALAAQPPVERGDFRPSDLVELTRLDSTIRLDVRYATDRNFLSVPVYTQARAFLQRPAAEALVRAHRRVKARGYGLLIHDGYRPWYVTKMFREGTPVDKHQFVADPAQGSRHNRGCAADLTLYDLRTGEPVVTTGGYDEMSDRSYPEYPGGTSRQRFLRELLRSAMEAEGFTVYEAEWWHFDYKDWRSYRIGNTRFEDLGQ